MDYNTPIKDPYVRGHPMVIYVQDEANRLAIYCRKCGMVVHQFNTVADLDYMNEWAKQHRADMRAKK